MSWREGGLMRVVVFYQWLQPYFVLFHERSSVLLNVIGMVEVEMEGISQRMICLWRFHPCPPLAYEDLSQSDVSGFCAGVRLTPAPERPGMRACQEGSTRTVLKMTFTGLPRLLLLLCLPTPLTLPTLRIIQRSSSTTPSSLRLPWGLCWFGCILQVSDLAAFCRSLTCLLRKERAHCPFRSTLIQLVANFFSYPPPPPPP